MRSPRVYAFLLLCVVLLASFFLTRNFLPVEAQPPLFASESGSAAASGEETATTEKSVEEVLVPGKQTSETPIALLSSEQATLLHEQPPSSPPTAPHDPQQLSSAEAIDGTAGAGDEDTNLDTVETEDSELEITPQETFPPRRYRVTTKTVVRDRPTWKGAEIARLKPNTKIHVVALTGDWLKVESRSQPPKPPGYVWKKDAKPE